MILPVGGATPSASEYSFNLNIYALLTLRVNSVGKIAKKTV